MIGQLNRRVTLKSYGDTQDEAGGLVSVTTASYTMWAKVEDRFGRQFTNEQQEQWSYDYKVTFRYEKSRPVKSNMTIDYDSKRLRINSLSFFNEGNRKYCIARCSASDLIEVDSGEPIEPGSSSSTLNIMFRVGDEGAAAAGDTDYIIPELIGLEPDSFAIWRNGLPMWLNTEYTFDRTTGKITLAVPGDKFNEDEQFLIK